MFSPKTTTDSVYDSFSWHSDAHRENTGLTILNTLRSHYTNLKVTATTTSYIELLAFARAGHASFTPISETASYQLRNFKGASVRSQSGSLSDVDYFAAYNYTWNNSSYILYLAEWTESRRMCVKTTFILSETQEAIDNLILKAGEWAQEAHGEVMVFDQQQWRKNKELFDTIQESSWDDVVMNPATKEALKMDIEGFFNAKDIYRRLKVPWKRGIIFHGPPGNGKTISIKALMNTLQKHPDNVQALYVKSLNGCRSPEVAIRSIFSKARSAAPCILIFEDIDSVITDELRSYFLNEVDGLESNTGILMIGSTNHLDRLDPGIAKRPSRFDRKYYFPLPGFKERVNYCEYWRQKLADNDDLDFPQELDAPIAELTDGFSFAYVKEAFVGSLLLIAHGRNENEDESTGSESEFVSVSKEDRQQSPEEERVAQDESTHPELDKYLLWRIMKRQVATLKAEMEAAEETAVPAPEKNKVQRRA